MTNILAGRQSWGKKAQVELHTFSSDSSRLRFSQGDQSWPTFSQVAKAEEKALVELHTFSSDSSRLRFSQGGQSWPTFSQVAKAKERKHKLNYISEGLQKWPTFSQVAKAKEKKPKLICFFASDQHSRRSPKLKKESPSWFAFLQVTNIPAGFHSVLLKWKLAKISAGCHSFQLK